MLTTVLSWVWIGSGVVLILLVILHSPKGDGMGGIAASGSSSFTSSSSAEIGLKDGSVGVIPLKYFFSESMSMDSGEEVSTRQVKKILSEAVEAEEKRKPLTDEKLAILLKEKGYNIARRTIAKYREQLNIPVARLRKEL